MATVEARPELVSLNSGILVLGRRSKPNELPSAVTYANRTQAKKKAEELGAEWCVYRGHGRPFYVALASQFRNARPGTIE